MAKNAPRNKIIQISAPAVALFAVYSDGKVPPQSKRDLALVPCPVVAVMETEAGKSYVAGLVVQGQELSEPNEEGFLGYAYGEEDAVAQYVAPQAAGARWEIPVRKG